MTEAQRPTKESAPYRSIRSAYAAIDPEPDTGRTRIRVKSSGGIPIFSPRGASMPEIASASPEAEKIVRAAIKARRDGKMRIQFFAPARAPSRKSEKESRLRRRNAAHTSKSKRGMTKEEILSVPIPSPKQATEDYAENRSRQRNNPHGEQNGGGIYSSCGSPQGDNRGGKQAEA